MDNGSSKAWDRALPPDEVIFGHSAAMRQLRLPLEQIAGSDLPVLIYGETGTGKEVLASFIHHHSPRRTGPCTKISCAAIPASLLEAELFGYEQGAFTGAYSTKPGMVELADHGTLILDHISEIDVSIQAKLLQLLQNGTFSRIGGEKELSIDIRLICIMTHNPQDELAEGKLRLGLFHRINAASFRVPELWERPEDIAVIADYLVHFFNGTFGTKAQPLSPRVHRLLRQYSWPGNIRELENVIRRYVILGYTDTIAEEIARRSRLDSPDHLAWRDTLSFKAKTDKLVREAETQAILRVLYLNNWNRRKTAEMLSISYRALLYKIRNAGLDEYSPSKCGHRREELLSVRTPTSQM